MLISDPYHPYILYLRQQGCEDPWLVFEAERVPRVKKFGKHRYRLRSALLTALFSVYCLYSGSSVIRAVASSIKRWHRYSITVW